MRALPKKVRRELSVNESLYRWYRSCYKDLEKGSSISTIVQRKGQLLWRLPIIKIVSTNEGLIIEVGE